MTTPHASALEFDPLASHSDPYPIYRRLRDEAPVHHNEQRGIWSVTRFDDVMHVLKTPEIFVAGDVHDGDGGRKREDPVLDVDRDLSGFPGFGFGKHFCLGASLARLETRIAFEALVPELVRLERSERTIPRVDSFLVRGPKRLVVQRAA
jgi:cytochrome P450